MRLCLEGDVHLVHCLALGSLVSIRVDGMEGVGVNRRDTIFSLRLLRKYCIGNLVNDHTGAIRVSEVQPPY